MRRNYKVNINNSLIYSKHAVKNKKARMQLKNEIVKDTRKYVPLRTGTLANSANHSINKNDNYIRYATPYAKFLYYGKVMIGKTSGSPWANKGETKVTTNRNLTYARGGSKWFEKSKTVNLKKWLEMVKKVYK